MSNSTTSVAPTMDLTQNKGPEFIAIFAAGLAVAMVLVAMRLWVRIKIIGKVGFDDYVMVASLIVTTAAFSCLAASVYYGLGMHLLAVEQKGTMTPLLKIFWAAMFMTPSAEAFAKFSITLMLIRVTTSKRWAIFFYTLIGLFSCVTIVTLAADVTQCKPLGYLWNPLAYPDGTCNRGAEISTAYLQGVSAALYDVILATSPIFLLWNVQIDTRRKIALCSVLALGFFTSIAGILRTAYTPGALNIADFTWTVMDFMIWKAVELPLSIIVGCLPTLRPLISKVKELTNGASRKNGYQVQINARNSVRIGQPKGSGGSGGSGGTGVSSSDDESRLHHGSNSIVKETTWVVEEEV